MIGSKNLIFGFGLFHLFFALVSFSFESSFEAFMSHARSTVWC